MRFKGNVYLTVTVLAFALENCSDTSFSGGLAAEFTLSGAIHAPAVTQPYNPGDVVGLQVQNNTDHADGPQIVTFGHAFATDEVPAGTQLVALVNGQQIPAQVDVKATNTDGSVRFAVITLAPAIAAHGAVDVMLAKGTPAARPDVQVSSVLQHGYDLQLHLTMHNSDGTTTPITINAANVLAQTLQNGTAQTWLDGPLANEVRVTAPINQYLTATFDIRAQADGSVHTDVTVGSNTTYTTGNHTFVYDVQITEGGAVAFGASGVHQYPHSDWHQEVRSNGQPDAHVVFDINHLIETGAIPAYDTSIGINSSKIDSYVNSLAAAKTGPLGNALVQTNMPEAGGRPDIGPNTTWAATYLVSQDQRAESVMLANANAAGSIPWHFYDEATGQPVKITDHPNVWLDSRAGGPDTPADPIYPADSGWNIDTSHQPALVYVPYLVTGSHYYLDELKMQAAYCLASYNPAYRGYADGNVDIDQVRAKAWTLRTLADAAYITPDSDPLKAYFVQKLDSNLTEFVQKYVVGGAMDSAGQVEGWIPGAYEPGIIAPWQEDFVAMTLNGIGQMGFQKANDLLAWMDNFESGRFLNADNGFEPLHGPAYNYDTYDPTTGQLFSTWQQVYQATFGSSAPPTQLDGYPDWAGGYAAIAKAALASIISATGSPKAREAYDFVVRHTPKMPADYANDPTWSVMARLPDGKYLRAADTQPN